MKIEYRDRENNLIQEMDARSKESYYKVFLKSKKKKVVERYYNQSLEQVFYYVESERIEKLLDDLFYESITFHTNKREQGEYIYYKSLLYHKKVLTDASISVKKGEEIMLFQKLDVNTHQPIFTTTEKHYYDENGEEKYSFEYDENGEVFMIFDEQEAQADFLASRIGQDDSIDFTWEGMEYYKDARQIFPN